MATGEIADSVREIASFRTKIKDIGSKVINHNDNLDNNDGYDDVDDDEDKTGLIVTMT